MPSWKKLISSGSSAVLSSLTLDSPLAVAQGGTGASNSNAWLNSRVTINVDGTLNYDATSTTAPNHDSLAGFVANEHIDHTGVTLTAGDGMTGGGTIAANRTFTVVGGDGITANANDVAVTAAQTTVTSMYNAALKIGRDTHNQFDFATDNVIKVSVNAVDDEFRFSAGGTFHADADIVAYSSTVASDMNLKENIIDTKYGLDTIMQLRGVDFDWKREDMGRSIGVLAQEVEKIIPEVVKEYEGLSGRENFKTVDYNKLVPILIESVKTLKSEIEILKKKVN